MYNSTVTTYTYIINLKKMIINLKMFNFYIIAIIFLILDIEIILMFPWVLSLKIIGLKAYYKTLFLFLILALGFIFEWFNNSLNWVK